MVKILKSSIEEDSENGDESSVAEDVGQGECDVLVPYFFFSTRFGVAVLGFLGMVAMNAQRLAWSLVIPCILNSTAITDPYVVFVHEAGAENSTLDPSLLDVIPESYCDSGVLLQLDVINTKLNFPLHHYQEGDLLWSRRRQSILLDANFYCEVLSVLMCGWLAERFGGRKIYAVGVAALSLAGLLTPLAAQAHYYLLLLLRIIAGLGAGACIPAMHAMWGKWAPPLERTILCAICYSGLVAGRIVIAPLVTGLCRYGFLGGWPSVFYVLGAYGFLWSVMWYVVAREFPRHHGRLSMNEKRYLHATLITETILKPRKYLHVPLVSIVTSLPFVATLISHFAYEWGLAVYTEVIPVYFSTRLNISYKENAFFSVVPPLGAWIFLLLSGMWTDQLRSRGVLKTAPSRKIMNTIGTVMPSAVLIALGFLDCRHWIPAVCLLSFGFTFLAFQYSGWWMSGLDMAPQYAGFLMGVTLSIATLARRAAPALMQHINTQGSQEQWQTFLFLSATLMILAGLIYIAFGTGFIQDWGRIDDDEKYPEALEMSPSDSESSYTSCSSHSFLPKKLRHLDDVFLASPESEQVLGLKYSALPRPSVVASRGYSSLPWPETKASKGAANIDKYSTLPKAIGSTSQWHNRKHSDADIHQYLHSYRSAFHGKNAKVLSMPKKKQTLKLVPSKGIEKIPSATLKEDPPSSEQPSSSSYSSGKGSGKKSKKSSNSSQAKLMTSDSSRLSESVI